MVPEPRQVYLFFIIIRVQKVHWLFLLDKFMRNPNMQVLQNLTVVVFPKNDIKEGHPQVININFT